MTLIRQPPFSWIRHNFQEICYSFDIVEHCYCTAGIDNMMYVRVVTSDGSVVKGKDNLWNYHTLILNIEQQLEVLSDDTTS